MEDRLSKTVPPWRHNGDHWTDAAASAGLGKTVRIPPTVDPITEHSNSAMIHEMLRRGYAVMKVPEDGKLKGMSDGPTNS